MGSGGEKWREKQMGLICKMKKINKKDCFPVSLFSSNHVFKGLNVIIILVTYFTKPYIF